MRSVGYRQALSYLKKEVDEATFVQQGLAATRQLAKRQMTWVRGMKNVAHLLCDDEVTPAMHAAAVAAEIKTRQTN